jgi:hypothetical protein
MRERWRPEDYKKSTEKTKWNPNVSVGGAWREDLYHTLMHKG